MSLFLSGGLRTTGGLRAPSARRDAFFDSVHRSNNTVLGTPDSGQAYTADAGTWGVTDAKSDTTATLASDITTTDGVTFTASDGTKLAVGDWLVIDTETMLVLSIATDTITVTRGYNTSTAATHSSGATIYLVRQGWIYSVTNAGDDRFSVDSGIVGSFEWDVKSSNFEGSPGAFPSVTFRGIDANNFLTVRFITPDTLRLSKRDATVTSTLVEAAGQTFTNNATYRVTALARGLEIAIFLDGVLKLSYTLAGGDVKYAAANARRIGAYLGGIVTAERFRNLRAFR